MKSLLIGGAEDTGKSHAIYNIAKNIQAKGYVAVAGNIPITFDDFMVVLKGTNNDGKDITVIINSATDNIELIRKFKKFFDNNGSYNALISSIRDDGYFPRQEFFEIMDLKKYDDFLLELPLAKITRIKYKSKALKWYSNKIDLMMNHVITSQPFNIT